MRRSLVRVAITLIAINAALAIVILLGGDMGDTGGRILGTSLLATGTAMVAMVQFPAMADRRLGPLPLLTIGAAAVGFAIVTTGIWTDMSSDIGWKVAGTAYVLAVAGAIASILSGVRIVGRAAWVETATLWAVGLAAVMIVAGIWLEIDLEGYWRFFAVVAVLVAAGGLAIPILSRSSAPEPPSAMVSHCPYCGATVESSDGANVTCGTCGRRFSVTLHEPPRTSGG